MACRVGTFQFFFSLLPGDYNQDGMVSDSGDDSDLLVSKMARATEMAVGNRYRGYDLVTDEQ